MTVVRSFGSLVLCGSATLSGQQQACAQVAPVTVTPPTLVPRPSENKVRVELPENGTLQPPAGSERLAVSLAQVRLENAFPEVAAQTDKIVAGLVDHRITLREIYAAASEIEAIHARAGFVLARVSVPPQDLADGGTLKIVVTDGFIEAVDTAALPPSLRKALAARTAQLIGQHHVKLATLEAALLIAGDAPGVSLRSTLARGTTPGGVKLLLSGTRQLVNGSLSADNSLAPSLGRWLVTAQAALNAPLGFGEQFYGFVASGYDLGKLFSDRNPVRVVGGGVLLPVGNGRLSFNPEITYSRTRPATLGGPVQTIGTLRRISLRANLALDRTRFNQGAANFVVEQISEANVAPAFDFTISRDRYSTARLGTAWSWQVPGKRALAVNGQISQGLGSVGARSAADVAVSGVPFSRQGANPGFTKLQLGGQVSLYVAPTVDVRIQARGQTSFGNPLFRAEQFAMEGADGVSAYVGGVTAVDEGAVGRIEIGARQDVARRLEATPYLFGAAGTGRLALPTVLEPGRISVAAAGVGVRMQIIRRFRVGIEYAHGFSNISAFDRIDRGNLITTISF